MLGGSRRTFAALALAAGLSALLGGVAAGPAAADDKAIAQALRAGGLVIVLRHGATSADQVDVEPVDFDNIAAQRNLNDKGKAAAVAFGNALSSDVVDVEPVDFDNIAAQRNLNDKGKAAAVAFGNAFRQIGIPVGKVYRAYETAT